MSWVREFFSRLLRYTVLRRRDDSDTAKMILFLDDDPNRAALFHDRLSPEVRRTVIWCQTAEEAIITLRDYYDRLEYVMLDHDLGGQQFVHSGREDCGMEVVRWLEHIKRDDPHIMGGLKNARYLIHTWNTSAGHKMVDRQRHIGLKATYVPFGS